MIWWLNSSSSSVASYVSNLLVSNRCSCSLVVDRGSGWLLVVFFTQFLQFVALCSSALPSTPEICLVCPGGVKDEVKDFGSIGRAGILLGRIEHWKGSNPPVVLEVDHQPADMWIQKGTQFPAVGIWRFLRVSTPEIMVDLPKRQPFCMVGGTETYGPGRSWPKSETQRSTGHLSTQRL